MQDGLVGRLRERFKALLVEKAAQLETALGGRTRARVILVLAAVLSLQSADLGTIGAVAPELKSALSVSNTQIGLLATVVLATGAVASLPFGSLADHVNRTRLLAIAIALWICAMVASAVAPSFGVLLLTRIGLGFVAAAAGPVIASLIGDYFAASERGRVYGWIQAGELIGVGVAFVVLGNLAALWSWRVAFWLLAVAALWVVPQVWRLPEPGRGGRATLPIPSDRGTRTSDGPSVERAVMHARIEPSPGAVLTEDPSHMHLPAAVRAVLRVRTNVVLIIASALGYFFFAGLRTFALVFVEDHYHVSAALATTLALVIGLGLLIGVLSGGHLADWLIGRGFLSARVLVGGAGYLVAVALLFPALLVTSLEIAVPLLLVAGMALAGVNPPIDGARLDIMHHRLWGRAEAVRTVLRSTGEALAPLLFGFLSDTIASGGTTGLQVTFLIMLLPLAVSGIIVIRARETYPHDIAAAVASTTGR